MTNTKIGSYVLLTVEDNLAPEAYQVTAGHTVPMYASLFLFGFVYELLLFWDSLRLTSMIQVVGLCIYNLLLTVYAIFQPRQIHDALGRLEVSFAMGERPILDPDSHVWQDIKPALIALIGVLAVCTAAMCFIAYRLHAEFAWLVYKVIHADIGMRRRVFTLEVSARCRFCPVSVRMCSSRFYRSTWPSSSSTSSSCSASSSRTSSRCPTRVIRSLA